MMLPSGVINDDDDDKRLYPLFPLHAHSVYPTTAMTVSSARCLNHMISLCLYSQGRHLKRGSRLVDFDIKLGDSECVPVSLTDKEVDCRPSEDIRNISYMKCPDETLSADVCICFLCSEAV